MISAKSVFNLTSQAGIYARGITRIAEAGGESGPDLSPIDLTAATLDRRVSYTGPAHTYHAANGQLATSAANVWPLEYDSTGAAVGRHEPEPAAINYLLDSAFANIADTGGTVTAWIRSQGSGISVSDNGQFDVAVCNAVWTATGVYSEGTSGWLAAVADQSSGADWGTVSRTFTNTAEAQIRYYIVRAVDGGATNYLYGKAPALPAGDYVASERRRLTDTNLECRGPQVEAGSVPTSPIFNSSDINAPATASRAASSVTVKAQDGATGVNVHYSDGTTTAISFNGAASVAIPLATLAWASRYITQITYEA